MERDRRKSASSHLYEVKVRNLNSCSFEVKSLYKFITAIVF
jgi:hypothetical protein